MSTFPQFFRNRGYFVGTGTFGSNQNEFPREKSDEGTWWTTPRVVVEESIPTETRKVHRNLKDE